MIKFAVGGIPVNDETLAVDVIAEVGAFKDFLSHEHTMKHMREQSPSALIDRRVREEWEASGSMTLYERATAKAREILDTLPARSRCPRAWPPRCATSSPTPRRTWAWPRPWGGCDVRHADYERLSELVIAGEMEGARALTEQLLAQGLAGREILDGGLLPGMEVVGARMKAGECFIPEVLLSRAHHAGLPGPHQAPPGGRRLAARAGTILMGTVRGRRARHRQEPGRHAARGGRLYASLNLGAQICPAAFVAAVREHSPADPRHERPLDHHHPQDGRHHQAAHRRGLARRRQGDGRRRPGHAALRR